MFLTSITSSPVRCGIRLIISELQGPSSPLTLSPRELFNGKSGTENHETNMALAPRTFPKSAASASYRPFFWSFWHDALPEFSASKSHKVFIHRKMTFESWVPSLGQGDREHQIHQHHTECFLPGTRRWGQRGLRTELWLQDAWIMELDGAMMELAWTSWK